MNNDEKIRKYLDGELSGSELEKFEKEINNSPELKQEIESFINTISYFKKWEKIETDEEYFINLIPRLREKLAEPKKFSVRPSFAAGGIVVAIALLLFLFNRTPEVVKEEQLTLQQINIEELNDYYSDYTREITTTQLLEEIPEDYDSLFSTVMGNELNIDDYSQSFIVDVAGNEFNNIIEELSEEEIEGIYNNIIKKDFN